MGDCEMKSFWGSWVLGEVENFQTELLDIYATRPVRQENLKITKLNQESKNIMHKAERIQQLKRNIWALDVAQIADFKAFGVFVISTVR